MAVPLIEPGFSSGELAPSLWGRVDISKFHTAASTLRNCFVNFRGGANSRAGTAFVGRSKQNRQIGDPPPRLINFNFSLTQNYALEFGDHYMRIIANGGFVLESAVTITGASQANPCQIVAANSYSNGDWIVISGVVGMTQLNGNTYIVAGVGPSSFFLNDLDGNPVDSTGFGAYVSGGQAQRIYTVVSPFADVDLPYLKFTQSADVMTFTCVNPQTSTEYPPYDLARMGNTNWTFTAVTMASKATAPASCTVTATVQPSGATSPPTLPAAYAYVVTSIDPDTGEESLPSPVGNVTNGVDMAATAGSNIVSWSAVPGASNYRVYRAPTSYNTDPGDASNALPVPVGALFGLVSQALGTQFVDDNGTADFAISPPQQKNPIFPGQITGVTVTAAGTGYTSATASITTSTGTGAILTPIIVSGGIVAVLIVSPGHGYAPGDTLSISGTGSGATGTLTIGPQTGTFPGVVGYFQQRRMYAASLNQPDTYWGSQPGSFNNFDTSIPVGDTDAVSGSPWSEQVNGIQWLVEMPLGLIVFTGSAVEQLQASGSTILQPQALTPANQQALPQSSMGASSILGPVRVNWEVLYFEPDNATVRDLSYQLWFNLYTGVDVTWQSQHLTQFYPIVDRAWCRKPSYLLWMPRADGTLLSLTFFKEQEIAAWARHTTQGQVRAVCSTTELPVDALYLVVERHVFGSGTRYFIERMDDHIWPSVEDAWCVDCGVGTVLKTRDANLLADTVGQFGAETPVAFTSSPPVFTADDVGSTVRMGGGIAVVTEFVSSSVVNGVWVYPCQEIVADGPTPTPLLQTSGNWTITPQVMTVGGLSHLAGLSVVGLADGVPVGPLTVATDGTVALPFRASNVKLGLSFTAQVQSVYLDAGQPTVQGRRKSISAVTVRCEASGAMQAGANEIDSSAQSPPSNAVIWGALAQAPVSPQQFPATYSSPGTYSLGNPQKVTPLFTGDARIPIPSGWKRPGQIAAQQTLPLPLNVTAFVPELLEGDLPEQSYSRQPPPQQAPSALPRPSVQRGMYRAA